MAALKPYHFGPNMLQLLKEMKIGKWIIAGKNIHFTDLVKDAKSVAGFSPFHKFQVGYN